MFTGIVAGMGRVGTYLAQGHEARVDIEPLFAMDNIIDGESIAINGVCLSVETHQGNCFTAYASGETLAKTNLSQLSQGALVNLERALAVGGRLGGHIVTGHVDCLAEVENICDAGESKLLRVTYPRQFSSLVIEKGSVALNGISLTVNQCGGGFLQVNVIPDSQGRTNFQYWRSGTKVNMETDILGKYVQRMLKPYENESAINEKFLAMHGFI